MDPGVAVVLAAVVAAAPPTVLGLLNRRSLHEANRQLETLNGSTPGELAAAAETRRIEPIPHDERTVKEQQHMDAAPEPDPPQGPAR